MKTGNFKLPAEKQDMKLTKPASDYVPRLILIGAVLGGGFVLYQLLKKRKKKKTLTPPPPKKKVPRMSTSQFINSMIMLLLEMAHQKLKTCSSKVNGKTPAPPTI